MNWDWLKIGAFPLNLFLTAGLAAALIPLFKRWGLGQRVRTDGPQTHLVKNGTPTMGGFFFLPGILTTGLLLWLSHQGWLSVLQGVGADILVFCLTLTACAALGFADDYIKVYVDRGGLTVRQKTLGQSLICLLVSAYLVWGRTPPLIYYPWGNRVIEVTGAWTVLYFLFLCVYFYFCINAVNLTDGVDGLAASVTAVTVLVVLPLSLFFPAPSWLPTLVLAIAGGCVGFLFHNTHPASIMMGDTGSLALGAAVSLIPVLLGVPWVIACFGFIYLVEAFSVVIQVAYFKATGGKRIFRMSPIHHHFELKGWTEEQIVLRFTGIQFVALLLGLLLVYLSRPILI